MYYFQDSVLPEVEETLKSEKHISGYSLSSPESNAIDRYVTPSESEFFDRIWLTL